MLRAETALLLTQILIERHRVPVAEQRLVTAAGDGQAGGRVGLPSPGIS